MGCHTHSCEWCYDVVTLCSAVVGLIGVFWFHTNFTLLSASSVVVFWLCYNVDELRMSTQKILLKIYGNLKFKNGRWSELVSSVFTGFHFSVCRAHLAIVFRLLTFLLIAIFRQFIITFKSLQLYSPYKRKTFMKLMDVPVPIWWKGWETAKIENISQPISVESAVNKNIEK